MLIGGENVKMVEKKQNIEKEKQSNSKNQKWLTMIIFILGGGACGFIGMYCLEKLIGKDAGAGKLICALSDLIILMYIVMFGHIIIHELGHLVFGLLTGYQFASFRIGSLMFVKKEGKIKVKKFSLMGTGGQCLMMPPKMENGTMPYRLYNLGGVIFNMILGGIGLVLFFVLHKYVLLQLICILFAIIGMGAAMTNGIPIHGDVDNDGANVCSLGKNPEALRSFWIQLQVNALITKEARIKDMPGEWFRVPAIEDMKNNALCTAVGVFACNYAMDRKDFEKAGEIAEKLLNNDINLTFLYKELLIMELCFCELIGEKRTEVLEQTKTKDFERFARAMSSNPSVLRMQYAYELLEKKDQKAAQKKLEQFEKVAKNYPHTCEIEAERELIEIVKQKDKEEI